MKKETPSVLQNLLKEITKNNETFQRETDTMDTFFDSSWYFPLLDPENTNEPFSKERANRYLPVDYYIEGIEHACYIYYMPDFSQKHFGI